MDERPGPLASGSQLRVGWLIQPCRALCKNLAAGFGDADRMLELRRERAVAGDGCPAVVEQLYVGAADVDHRLDGEDHAGLELGARAGAAGVDHFWAVVEQAADAVAAEIADDAVALTFGVALDGVGDIAEMVSGPRLLEAEHQ